MSKAKKYDRSYKEQSVKLALEIGVKRASEELKVPYGTLYGWVQAAKNGDLDIEERTPENAMSLAEEIRQLRSKVKRLNKENKRLQEKRYFLNEAAAFSPRAVGSKQAGANEVHRAQNLRWRRKRQEFILLQSAGSDTSGVLRIPEES